MDLHEIRAIVAYFGGTENTAEALDLDEDIVQRLLGGFTDRWDANDLETHYLIWREDNADEAGTVDLLYERFDSVIPEPITRDIINWIQDGTISTQDIILEAGTKAPFAMIDEDGKAIRAGSRLTDDVLLPSDLNRMFDTLHISGGFRGSVWADDREFWKWFREFYT